MHHRYKYKLPGRQSNVSVNISDDVSDILMCGQSRRRGGQVMTPLELARLQGIKAALCYQHKQNPPASQYHLQLRARESLEIVIERQWASLIKIVSCDGAFS